MSKLRESHGALSRLPGDRAYWDGLAARLAADAAGRLSAYRRARVRWWQGLARFATPLAVGAAAAVIAALLWLPRISSPVRDRPPAAPYGLVPTDPLAALLVSSENVPTMATLLATPTLERIP